MVKKYLGNIIKLALSLGVGVALIYWFIGQMSESDKQHVVEDIKRANYFWVLMGPAIGLASNYFRSERWRILLKPLGYTPGAVNTFLSVLIMYFLNLFFPRLGEVSRCGVLTRYEKVPMDKAIGTMVLERLLDVIFLALIIGFLLIAENEKILSFYNNVYKNASTTFGDIIAKNSISATVKYTVLGTVASAIIAFLAMQVRKKGFGNISNSIQARVMGLLKGLVSIKDVKNPFMLLFHSVMIWVCYFLMIYVSFRMFPETAGLSLLAGGMCLVAGGVAYSLTPGGLGLYPIFIQLALGLYGVAGSAGVSLGLVVWTAQTISVLLAGVISLILLAIINREPSLKEEVAL